MPRALPILWFCTLIQPAVAAEMPMMVHSDAKRFEENGHVNACALLITATNINGEYISAVIKLLDDDGQTVMDYTVLSGHIDYRNGNEVYDYVENAWLTVDKKTTRDKSEAGRGPSDYAYQARYRDDALSFYESVVHKPFDLGLVTTMHNQPYTHTFEQPFDQFVMKEAKNCLQAFKAEHVAASTHQ